MLAVGAARVVLATLRVGCRREAVGLSRRLLGVAALTLLAALTVAGGARALGGRQASVASSGRQASEAVGSRRPPEEAGTGVSASDLQTLHLLLALLPVRYASAQPTHETQSAAVVRLLARGAERRVAELRPQLAARYPAATARALRTLVSLQALLAPTTQRFDPWPLTLEVDALSAQAQRQLAAILPAPGRIERSYPGIDAALEEAQAAALGGDRGAASFDLLRAYVIYASGPGQRLLIQDPQLDGEIARELLLGGGSALVELLARGAGPAAVARAAAAVNADLTLAAQTLGEVHVSHTTIVIDGAIIVFREGLEAVLILAALTASFVGAKRHLRRPVLVGAVAGLGATALTWVVAQMMLHMLGEGGLELQAITGLIAIGVLLLVTNWFFHRVYWSQWIARFNRRRKAIERWDRLGFVSGQVFGLALLGLSSVYREGLETVLFLQALQTSAGTGATLLGAGIGLGGTLIVGTLTLKLQRKLPFKRMLILTGVLIALVLAVMVGTTVHNLQGIGWLPIAPTSFSVPIAWSTWLGVYPTWQGIAAQIASPAFVLGSYFAAREIQVRRPQRRARAAQVARVPHAAA
ncbi:MAG TPA: FTR1 family protein [Solirubrobacteraceae bacterium]|jgi:high-affinity iron transporter|nr:FTR1 family protein [Solirubrobacteraceae bacterium]